MKYLTIQLIIFFFNCSLQFALAQENMHPAPVQTNTIIIKNGTIHIGNGKVISNGTIKIENGKISEIGETISGNENNATVIDASGKHIYPGIIAASTNLGLIEVAAVRSTADFSELGDMNPSIRSIVAYNTDSKVINTIRSNGILLAHIVPSGGTISGMSSVVQLDAWNWEDAAYKMDNGIHLNMPVLLNRPDQLSQRNNNQGDPVKKGLNKIEEIYRFFKEAKAYNTENVHTIVNLKYEAVKELFAKTKTLFVHCDLVKEILAAINMAKEFGFKLCIVGGSDSWIIADILKENSVSVILSEPHSLPSTEDDDIDQPYKTGSILQKAGVLFTICQDAGDGFWQQRNLPFEAGTMATYGLSKEEALAAITLNVAKILGIDDKTGSLETGKDANIIISTGDLLNMKTNNVIQAFIQGREINLDNKQNQLYKRFKYKYNIK